MYLLWGIHHNIPKVNISKGTFFFFFEKIKDTTLLIMYVRNIIIERKKYQFRFRRIRLSKG